ncbi:hypothetical protein ABBQ32_001375 [Trebouxia sp. C0010 RCD-2024]
MVDCAADGLLSVSFTDLRGSQPPKTQPTSGIFTTVCDASTLTADPQATWGDPSQALQGTMAGASALVVLLTRADNPAHTEASLRALLGASPSALKVPLVLLTTALDLHQGVQQWVQTLPGKPHNHCYAHCKLGRLWQHVGHVQTFCLAQKPQQKPKGCKPRTTYSRAALRDALKWAAAHSPAQPSLKALPLEQLLPKQLELHLEPLRTAHYAAPSAWIATFNQMLIRTWQEANGAADVAKGIGGWPAPEIGKVDATLPEQWWQPQALACLEGALSSLCLPGMPASLGASPHQAVRIYVQHYLGISPTSQASWQQILAAAMHSRIQAVQQQNLAPVVVAAHVSPPPLLPHVTAPCRLSQASGLPVTILLNGNAHPHGVSENDTRHQLPTSSVSAQLLGTSQPDPAQSLLQAPALPAVSGEQISVLSRAPHTSLGHTSTSYAAAVRASNPHGASRARVSYADVVVQPSAPKFSKRKVPEENMLQEYALPMKRHQNGFDVSLSSLQEQSSQLLRLLRQSRADCSDNDIRVDRK